MKRANSKQLNYSCSHLAILHTILKIVRVQAGNVTPWTLPQSSGGYYACIGYPETVDSCLKIMSPRFAFNSSISPQLLQFSYFGCAKQYLRQRQLPSATPTRRWFTTSCKRTCSNFGILGQEEVVNTGGAGVYEMNADISEMCSNYAVVLQQTGVPLITKSTIGAFTCM